MRKSNKQRRSKKKKHEGVGVKWGPLVVGTFGLYRHLVIYCTGFPCFSQPTIVFKRQIQLKKKMFFYLLYRI